MAASLFTRFLRERDSFGHTIQVAYKGKTTHNSVLGGILTLVVKALTLIMLLRAVEELVFMRDPLVLNQTKPIPMADRADVVPIKFNEYEYVIAINFAIINSASGAITYRMPDEIGTLAAYRYGQTMTQLKMVNCTEVLPQSTIEVSNSDRVKFDSAENIYCLDPKDAATSSFNDNISADNTDDELMIFMFESCASTETKCLTPLQQQEWFK